MKPAWYEAFGDALGEGYLRYPWVSTTAPDCDYLERVLDVAPGDRLLDVGCGVGRHAIELAKRGYRMTGIDVSRGLLEVGERLAREAGVDAMFRHLDARLLDFDSEFDAAYSICEGAFSLVPTDEENLAILEGMRRAVKPGARVSVGTGHVYHTPEKFRQLEPVDNGETVRAAPKLFEGEPEFPEEACSLAFTARELRLMSRLAGLECLAVYGGVAGNYTERPPERGDWELILLGRRPDPRGARRLARVRRWLSPSRPRVRYRFRSTDGEALPTVDRAPAEWREADRSDPATLIARRVVLLADGKLDAPVCALVLTASATRPTAPALILELSLPVVLPRTGRKAHACTAFDADGAALGAGHSTASPSGCAARCVETAVPHGEARPRRRRRDPDSDRGGLRGGWSLVAPQSGHRFLIST